MPSGPQITPSSSPALKRKAHRSSEGSFETIWRQHDTLRKHYRNLIVKRAEKSWHAIGRRARDRPGRLRVTNLSPTRITTQEARLSGEGKRFVSTLTTI